MKSKNGFTLIELLVVIAIIGIIMLISFPMVDKLLSKNKKSIYDNYRNILEKSAKKYMDDTGFLVSGCYEVTFKDLKNQGMLNGIPDECSESKIYITSDDKGKATGYKVNLVCNDEKIIQEYTNGQCEYKVVQYKDSYGGNIDQSGSNAPQLGEGFVPIKYDGKKWVTADLDNTKVTSNFNESYAWYDYNNEYWANAVILKSNTLKKSKEKYYPGQKIKEDNIKEWWVWIPNSKTSSKKGFWLEKYSSTNETPTTFISLYMKDYNRKRKYDSHMMSESEQDALRSLKTSSSKWSNESYVSSTRNQTGIFLKKDIEELYGPPPLVKPGTLTYAFSYEEPKISLISSTLAGSSNLGGGCTILRTNDALKDFSTQKYTVSCNSSSTGVYYNKSAGDNMASAYKSRNGSRCPSGDDICYYTVNTPLYPHSSVDLSYVSGAESILEYDYFGNFKGKLKLVGISWSGGVRGTSGTGQIAMTNLCYSTIYPRYILPRKHQVVSYTTNAGDTNSLSKLFIQHRNTEVGYGFNSGISTGKVYVSVPDTSTIKEELVSRAAIYVE